MRLPAARGPITAGLFARLGGPPGELEPPLVTPPRTRALEDGDLQLALFVCYELHYRGFDDVDDRWEWQPSLLAARRELEYCLESGLAHAVPRPQAVPPQQVHQALTELVAKEEASGPALAAYLQHEADLGRFREFVAHRSIYHLKEADPHTWAIPRLHGGPKAALVEIQADEYGGGRAERMHAELFRSTMAALGLDGFYGAYLDRVPGITLAVSNVMSLFGLHRRLRGALAGNLAALEMTSSLPNRRYALALRRLGGDAVTTRFYEEHIQADAVHEQVAAHDLCAALAAQDPSLSGDILYGAACALTVERRWAEHVMDRWQRGLSSLEGDGDLGGHASRDDVPEDEVVPGQSRAPLRAVPERHAG